MTIVKSGVYYLPLAEYHGQPADALSMSASDAIQLEGSTPAHLQAYWRRERTASRKADLGTVVHCLLLEPYKAEKSIAIIEADNYRSKDAQLARDEALAAGKTPALWADYRQAALIAEVVQSHPDTSSLLEKAIAEQSYFAKDEKLGIYVKARPDIVTSAGALADIKTVGSCATDFLERRVWQGGWFMQAPWHCDVFERVTGDIPADYFWICVEQTDPYAVRVFSPSQDALAQGHAKNLAAREIFAECARRKEWPAYPPGITELGLPSAAHFKLADEEAARADIERYIVEETLPLARQQFEPFG